MASRGREEEKGRVTRRIPGLRNLSPAPGRSGVALVLPVILALLSINCQRKEPGLSPGERARLEAIGSEAAEALATGLSKQLRDALETRGTSGAIEFCAARALPLTRQSENDLPDGIELKRTSLRIRNPANAPDSLEAAALRHLHESTQARGSPSQSYVQQAGPGVYRYYRSLIVQPLCVRCHGPVESMDTTVRATIEAGYPGDRATGYEVGDLRGAIRVSVPIRHLRDPADDEESR